ncbi:uncharacterized protein LOC125045951 [Penaeus chinensis]|uniref:uncharacterized protein LOC125045951 n=1 Tax=Penaeus chinensis TaxID=139456 RepID=UPI001FB71737|nr:uncharacterized protein LOC125045951 [Penaeus chinensis]
MVFPKLEPFYIVHDNSHSHTILRLTISMGEDSVSVVHVCDGGNKKARQTHCCVKADSDYTVRLHEDEEDRVKAKKKRLWVHECQRKRKSEGEFWTLYKELDDDETKFYQYFRMTKSKFNYLLQKVNEDLIKSNTCLREAISPRESCEQNSNKTYFTSCNTGHLSYKLMCFLVTELGLEPLSQFLCLMALGYADCFLAALCSASFQISPILVSKFLATGDSFRTIAFSYRLGHSTVHSTVQEVCASIIKRLKAEVMPKPTEETWKNIAAEFWNLWQFPNCVGAIDGKHVKLQAPPNSGSLFYNYKHTFSVVLLALVDANYKFVVVDIGSYGKNSDGGIFSHSKFGELLEKGALNIPPPAQLPDSSCMTPYVIVGDEAFPLKTYLLRPYPGSQASDDDQKRLFNFRLSRARRVVENAFGILSQRFRIYQRTLNLLPDNADNVIFATCILHNYLRDNATNVTNMNVTNNGSSLEEIARQGGNAPQGAFLVREKFREFLNSPAGSLPWA